MNLQASASRESNFLASTASALLGVERARDVASASEALATATKTLGCDVSAFLSHVPEPESAGTFQALVSCDPQWCIEYERSVKHEDDPWLTYAQRHSAPIRGEELIPTSTNQRVALDLAARYGFQSSIVVPVSGGPKIIARTAVLCLGSLRTPLVDEELAGAFRVAAVALAVILNEWWVAELAREFVRETRLTDAEIGLLREVSLGSTTKRIARATGETVYMVDGRFERLLVKIGAPHRFAAVKLAAAHGLL